ncbi:MAG: hypothetical protein R3F14_38025 [Polyangiaceae bacterium]
MRLSAGGAELFGAPKGPWDLCISVGDPAHLPDASSRPPARGARFLTACRPLEWLGPTP